jgi:hypothetical protein
LVDLRIKYGHKNVYSKPVIRIQSLLQRLLIAGPHLAALSVLILALGCGVSTSSSGLGHGLIVHFDSLIGVVFV